MKAAVTGLAFIFAIGGGMILYGSYFMGASHSETGPVATIIDSSWFFFLLALITICIMAVGGVAALLLRK